ncbi:MAG: tetratricopeptide repeat protein [Bacteroidales bacterium]
MKRYFLIIILFFSLHFAPAQALENEYANLIINCTQNSEYEQAIRICDKLITYKPESYYGYYLRGLNNYLLEDYDDAITDFDMALKLNPDFTDAYIKRAKAKSKSNNLIGAIADYNRARNDKFYETVTSFAGDVLWSVFSGKRDKKGK